MAGNWPVLEGIFKSKWINTVNMRTQLREDEKVLLIVREHWLVLLGPVTLVLCTMVGVIYTWIKFQVPRLALYAMLTLLFLFVINLIGKLLDRKTNIWVVTSLRVLDESGVLSRHFVESPMEMINNVSYDQSFLGRLMDYGNVTIQTAAEMGATTYYFLAHPGLLQQTIFNAQGALKKSAVQSNADALAQAMAAQSTTLAT